MNPADDVELVQLFVDESLEGLQRVEKINFADPFSADVKERTKLYQEMQVIEKDEAPDMKIAHSVVYEVMRKEVTGYKQSPFNSHEFKGVELK